MMKRLSYVVMMFVVAGGTLASFEAVSQTPPPESVQKGTQLTFDKDDLLNAMTDAERQDFLDRRKELKELQEAGRSLKKGSAGRKVVLAEFQSKQAEFDEKFDHLRGFRGKTVMVYGNPPPTKQEIMTQVNSGSSFRGGSFGHGIDSHWTREKSGAIVGSVSPPKVETVSTPTPPPTPTPKVSKPKPRSTPRSSGPALTPEQHCRKMAGPPRSEGLTCFCGDPRDDVFGVPSCWWVK